jgi:hypothetical protein
MSPPDEQRGGGLSYRMQQLENAVRDLEHIVQEQAKVLVKLEPLPRAAYWLIGVVLASAIGFAFSVLTLIP